MRKAFRDLTDKSVQLRLQLKKRGIAMSKVFVFGSNLAGIHGAGSARAALDQYGALWGIGEGRQGDSYAIPTKDYNVWTTLSIERIRRYADNFILHALHHPDDTFDVVKIGCGLAGFKETEIAPLFKDAPENVNLPEGWR